MIEDFDLIHAHFDYLRNFQQKPNTVSSDHVLLPDVQSDFFLATYLTNSVGAMIYVMED